MNKIHPWFRNTFLLGGFLSLASGIQLFVLGEQTEKYFAWTIQSFLTAATFGGFYFSTMMYGFLSARETDWAMVRAPAVSLLVFSSLTLVTSLVHLDKFHWSSSDWLARSAAWVWMLVYVLLPPLLGVAFYLQSRLNGHRAESAQNIPVAYRILLVAHGCIGVLIGTILLFIPQVVISNMPWALTPFTARALSAWLLSFGVVDLLTWWENDATRTRIFSVGSLVAGITCLLALYRYPAEYNLGSLSGVISIVYLASMVMVGLMGFVQPRSR